MDLLFAVSLDLAQAQRLVELISTLEMRPKGWFADWRSEGHIVRYYGQRDEPLHASWFGCSCPDWPGPPCAHIQTVLLLLAWRIEGGRRWFSAPMWELSLGRLLAPVPVAEARLVEAPHEGWIRYQLTRPEEPSAPWTFSRQIVRLGKRGQGELTPQPCPDTLNAIRAKLRNLTEADRHFQQAWEGWSELRRLYEARWAAVPERGRRLLAELEDRLVRSLVHARDLRFQDRAVRVIDEPLRPALVAESTPDGGLNLRWEPPALLRVSLGSGWALDQQGVLRPLAHDLPTPLLEALGRPLPQVAPQEVEGFVRQGLLTGRLPLRLAQPEALGAVEADSCEARLALSEEGEDLVVDLLFAYALDDAEHMASPHPPVPLLPLPSEEGEARWLLRDALWEADQVEAASEALGQPLPARFVGEEALVMLAERVPELARTWPIFGQERLTRTRVRGVLQPRLSLARGTDWFDLRSGFTLDDLELDSAAVIEAWMQGRPWLRLPDGALARLPDAWLKRHGRVLAELEELRRAGAGGLATLPLAAELLDQVEGDVAPWRALLARLEGHSGPEEVAAPAGLTAELRSYQLLGYRWLRWLRDLGLGAVLADDMGLGKTVQALALLVDSGGPSLVVAPTSAIHAWADEARRFAPGLRVRVHHGPRRMEQDLPGDADLVLTSYALLRLDAAALQAVDWRVVILDEAQNIKNPSSALSRAARGLRAAQRVALTGTPFENHLHELRSLFEFVLPGFFGSRQSFAARYAAPVERQHDPEALALLRRRIRPFVLRRLKREVVPELPPLQQSVMLVELSPEQRALYERVRETCRATVRARVDELGVQRAAFHILEALTRLRQACCHPALLPWEEARAVRGSAKLDALMEALDAAVAGGHRSLVFSQWPSLLEKVAERLRAQGWDHLFLRGETRARKALVDRWNDPEGPPVFLISLKAGGTALNLAAADHVFHLDPWWNPAAEAQATDRAHRIGQLRPVMAWRIVAKDTIEERILDMQDRKRAVFYAAMDEGRAGPEGLTAEDLQAVLEGLDAPGSSEHIDSAPFVQ